MIKKVGEQIDVDLHTDMLLSFTKFIENFSPLLDKTEMYQQNIMAENLINNSEENLEKLKIIKELNEILTEMIPVFFKFAKLEDKLEKFYTK